MTAEKRPESKSAQNAPSAATVSSTPASAPSGTKTERKAWVRRSNVDIVVAAIKKQEQRVADLEAELAYEKRELEKLSGAKKLLETK